MVYNIWVFNEGICFQFACIMDGCCNELGVSRIICPCGIKFLVQTHAGLKPKLKKKLNVVTYAEILLQFKNNGTRMQDIWHNEV